MAAADYKALVQSIYISYFGRPADTFGLESFTRQLDALKAPLTVNGLTAAYTTSPALKSLIDSFGSSAESTALYGTDTVAFVSAIYQNVLNRSPDFDGLVFWVNEINAGRLTKANASLAIMAGAINNTSAQGMIDAQVLANKVTIATNFTTAIDTGAELAAYQGNAAAAVARDMLKSVTATTVPATFQATVESTLLNLVNAAAVGTTFALTSAIDTFTGTSNNDTFNAVPTSTGAGTFTSLDKIDGGAGNDTLVITSNGALSLGSASGATVVNVENATLAAATTLVADVSGWTGLQNLNVSSTSGTVVTAASTTNVTELSSIADTTILAGKNVTVNHGGVANVLIDGASGDVKVVSTVGTVTVANVGGAVDIAAKGNIIGSGKTLTASALGATTYADQVAHRTANNAAATAKSNADFSAFLAQDNVDYLTTFNADLAAATTIAANNDITRTAVIDGYITVEQKVAIDLAFSNALNAPAASPAAAIAAAQAATAAIDGPLLISAKADNAAAISAAALATAATAAPASVVAADVVAAGANVAAGITVTSTSKVMTSASVTGNYLAAAPTVITDSSTLSNVLTSVSLANAAAATLNGNAINTVSLKDMNKNVTINNATANHALKLNLDNAFTSPSTAIVSDAAATSLTVNTVTASGINLATAQATSIKFTGAGAVSVSSASTFAATAAFDASAATGAVSLTAAAGQSFVGGAGNDTVTTGAAAQTAVIDGGAGTDRLVLTNSANFAGAAAAKFVGFETLQLAAGVDADVTTFTGSTFTGISLSGGSSFALNTKVIGLNAAQANNITVRSSGFVEVDVAGASTVGQLDTVKMIVSDGSSTRNTITLNAPDLKGVEVLNLTATDNIVIDSLTSATALTNINIDGAGTSKITTGAVALNVNTVIDGHLATRGVTVDASAATANGLKLIGSATAANTLTGNAFASVLVGGQGGDKLTGGIGSDVITAGNGDNVIVGGAGAGGDTVLVGDGFNSIVLAGSGAATVTTGNGFNVITTGSGADKITVGTGGNTINAGAGGDIITFGAHAAGVVDSIVYTANNETFQGGFVSGVTVLTGADVVRGMHTGDTINIGAFGFAAGATVGTAQVAVDNGVSVIKGSYDVATKIFTASATGADAIVQFDTDSSATVVLNDVVLVGFTGTVAAGANGLLTLV